MIIPALATGGAEWAFVRQANALVSSGCSVTCYVPFVCDSTPAILKAFDSRVQLLSVSWLTAFLRRISYKLSQTLLFDFEQFLHSRYLRALCQRFSFDVVNSHLNSGTMIACHAFKHSPMPLVETDHGDYALLLNQSLPPDRLELPLSRLDAMICLSGTNQKRISQLSWPLHFRSTIIPNCYSVNPSVGARPLPQDDTFTFGMVSRGVPEKGWEEAIEAFRVVRRSSTRPIRLILVGGSSHLQALERDLEPDLKMDVIFAGSQSDPQPWIKCFDVGLLPSYFAAESLPNVIIEYLAQGKPVVATDIGGIREMIATDDQVCGILVPICDASKRADIPKLIAAMLQMLNDAILLDSLARRTLVAIQRYRPEVVASALCAFFDSVSVSTSNTPKAIP